MTIDVTSSAHTVPWPSIRPPRSPSSGALRNASGTLDAFVVTYQNQSGNGAFFCRTASLTCGAPVTLSSASGAAAPTVAASSTSDAEFLAVWEQSGGIGYVIKGEIIPVSGGAGSSFSVSPTSGRSFFSANAGVSDGTVPRWLVAYTGYDFSTADEDVFLTTVDVATPHAVSGATSIPLSNNQSYVSVAGHGESDSSGAEVLVSWVDHRAGAALPQVFSTRVRMPNAGTFHTLDGPSGTGLALSNATAVDGPISSHSDDIDHYFVAWGDQRSNSFTDIYGNRYDWSGSVSNFPGFLVSRSANKQSAPAIAACNGKYLSAWSDTRNGFDNADIYASILDSSGTILVSNIAVSTATGRQDQPAVACNGTNFYVVWVDERSGNEDIYGTGIDGTTGAVLNAGGVAIATSTQPEEHPAIAFGGSTNGYMVVWERDPAPDQIVGAVVSSTTGLVTVSSFLLPTSARLAQNPDIDFDGTNYLVVWQEGNTGSLFDIYGVLVTPAGVPGTASTVIDAASNAQQVPKVAYNGVNYDVVFEDDSNISTAGVNIRGRSLNKTTLASVHSYVVASTADNDVSPRVVVRAGSVVEVVYARVPTSNTLQFEYDVFGQTVNNGVVSTSPYTLSAKPNVREMTPDVACAAKLSCMEVYREFDLADITTDIDRIQGRTVTFP